MSEKLLPQNIEAEMSVLGSILLDPEAIISVADFLQPGHFYRDIHQTIFAAMMRLYTQHASADYIILCDELERENKLQQIGGATYLAALLNHVPSSSNVEYYAKIVEKKWIFRQLARAAGEIVTSAYEEEADAMEKAEGLIFQINQGNTKKVASSHVDVLSRYMSNLMQLHEESDNGALTGIPSGFRALDTKLGGFRKSKLYILAARPGEGKTALALNFADAAVKSGNNVLFFSLEMDEEELMQRWVAMESMVDSTKLRDGRLSEEMNEGLTEWDRVMEAESRLRTLPHKLYIDDTPGNTDVAMRSKARRMQMEHGIDLIIVDYLQLAQAGATDRKLENRRLEVEQVSRNLKMLSRELQVPVIALAQLSREVESRSDRVPKLSDLREAGGIEQDCDVAMFIYKSPEVSKEDVSFEISVLIEKHRNGEKGSVPLFYVGPYTKFYPVNKEIMK